MEQNVRDSERTLEQIEADIERTKAELQSVHGTETEVYARIVGYYRAVRNWNKGKRDEYEMRKLFTMDESRAESLSHADEAEYAERMGSTAAGAGAAQTAQDAPAGAAAASFVLYTREQCPNCPPVKQRVAGLSIPGTYIDVDTDAGLEKAAAEGVFSTPTAILYAQDGAEIGRAHSVQELDALLAAQKEAVLA